MDYKSATDMARVYGLKSAVAFNKILVKCGILRTGSGGEYYLADSLRQLGYVAVVEMPFFLPNGFRCTKKKAVWTDAGQQYIHGRLARLGITPASEHADLFNQAS